MGSIVWAAVAALALTAAALYFQFLGGNPAAARTLATCGVGMAVLALGERSN